MNRIPDCSSLLPIVIDYTSNHMLSNITLSPSLKHTSQHRTYLYHRYDMYLMSDFNRTTAPYMTIPQLKSQRPCQISHIHPF